MYSIEERQRALDLWFERFGEVGMERFVAELGYPSRQTMSNWVRADPRHDPDKATYKSKPVLAKLEAIRRVAEGARPSSAGAPSGMTAAQVRDAVDRYARGGTAELLPKPRKRKKEAAVAQKAKDPWEVPPEVPGELPDDPAALKAIVRELQLDNATLREVLAVLKAARPQAAEPLTADDRVAVASALAPRFGAKAACGKAGVPRSTYYRRRCAPPRPEGDPELDALVRRAFEDVLGHAHGYRYVKEEVDSMLGRPVSEKRVLASMRRQGLVPAALAKAKRYSSYAGETDAAPPNLLLRPDGTHDFRPAAPGLVLASDITQFSLPDDGRRVYLSVVVDLWDGKPLGWSAGLRPDAELADSSLLEALSSLPPGSRPVVHTDRGCHYRWPGWKGICERFGAVRSMSRKGRSPDNAACEGFFGRMKNEMFRGRDWSGVSAEELMAIVDAYMARYSTWRRKSFEAGGRTVRMTIDEHRRMMGYAA